VVLGRSWRGPEVVLGWSWGGALERSWGCLLAASRRGPGGVKSWDPGLLEGWFWRSWRGGFGGPGGVDLEVLEGLETVKKHK